VRDQRRYKVAHPCSATIYIDALIHRAPRMRNLTRRRRQAGCRALAATSGSQSDSADRSRGMRGQCLSEVGERVNIGPPAYILNLSQKKDFVLAEANS